MFWSPLLQLQCILPDRCPCPHDQCHAYLIVNETRWNTGSSAGHCPRIVHDIDHMVLLVPAVYACPNGHEILATDPRLLVCIPEQEYVPFILFHCSGVMRTFARTVITLTDEGLSFNAIEHFIMSRRMEEVASLQLKLNYILSHSVTNIEGNTLLKSEDSIGHIFKPFPSNDLICKCFLKSFGENKHFYFKAMASLSTVKYISIDHTFKVAANLGYLRPDGRWITQYNSLFIVLNDIGQVLAWQLTKTSSIDECTQLLSELKQRLLTSGAQLDEIYVDNCCTIKTKLQSILGSHIHVYLDIFHATQRITKKIPKRHPLCKVVMKDIKMLFRDPQDKGQQRILPTPDVGILMKNLEFFIAKWRDAEVNGWHILNEKVLKELESLSLHVTRGCLSDIRPGCGTNKNENLHRCINPFFSRCRIGIPLAVALLTVLFHRHNQKLSTTATDCSILSARSLYPRVSNTDNFCFGIMKKTNTPDIDDWIFGKQMPANNVMIQFPSTVSKVIDFSVSPEINDIVHLEDIVTILQSSLHLFELAKTILKQTLLWYAKPTNDTIYVSCDMPL